MTSPQPSVIARDHTILGVCEALGEDFGFNPIWLRLAFALPLMFFPAIVFSLYLGLGAVVLLSRMLVRNPRLKADRVEVEEPVLAEPVQVPLPLAA